MQHFSHGKKPPEHLSFVFLFWWNDQPKSPQTSCIMVLCRWSDCPRNDMKTFCLPCNHCSFIVCCGAGTQIQKSARVQEGRSSDSLCSENKEFPETPEHGCCSSPLMGSLQAGVHNRSLNNSVWSGTSWTEGVNEGLISLWLNMKMAAPEISHCLSTTNSDTCNDTCHPHTMSWSSLKQIPQSSVLPCGFFFFQSSNQNTAPDTFLLSVASASWEMATKRHKWSTAMY